MRFRRPLRRAGLPQLSRFGAGVTPRDTACRPAAGDRPFPLFRRLHSHARGAISTIGSKTYAYHFHEPPGVVGEIIPWNFSILMAVWKLALVGVAQIKAGNPLDTSTTIGAQASQEQLEKSCLTWTSAARKAPRCWPAANAPDRAQGRQPDARLPG
jgi:acyl-CoA reductase-like NAD-dependent aldehyde dehydrogenase